MVNDTIDERLIQEKSTEKQSLCRKYDISIDKLDFQYISGCKNVKELERIVRILRSGEEGHYPDLQKQAEDKLQALAPNSRLLRVEEPLIRREEMVTEERCQVDNDMKQWVNDMSLKDEQLMDWNKNYTSETGSGDYIPPIRRAPQKKADNDKLKEGQQNSNKPKKPMVSDYDSWDKYDADTELLKMDAEEERKKIKEEVELKKQKTAAELLNKKAEHSRLNCLINTAKNLSEAEKSFHALQEKDRGNEYYKTCNYDDAIEYYSASIAISPTATAYNNRAASYLKQGKYDLALADVNNCLELDPENAKGLYRRGLCLQHKNKFDEALQDMQAVLRKEPHNLLVQHVAKELRQQCRSVPRSVRMLVEEEENDKVIEMSETEARRMKAGVEVNEWGLARSMCSCYGRPHYLRCLDKSGTADHLIYKPEDDKKKRKKKVSEKEIVNDNTTASQIQPVSENLIDIAPVVEVICNGNNSDEPMETVRIPFNRSSDNEDNELIPKKIKIIETVKSNNDSLGSTRVFERPKKCCVKDMRGHKHVQGQKESEMTEQFSNITIDESATAASKTENTNENKNRKQNVRQKQNNNQENNQRNSQQQQNTRHVRNYEFNVPSEKQPITIASKYTQKVATMKNVNDLNDSCREVYRNIHNINNISNIASLETISNESSLTPFQFVQLWSSVKDSDSSIKEYADILRRIQPSELHKLLGNQLDDQILKSMLIALSSEFDVTDHSEADLVKQYLVSISKVERFRIGVQFLSCDVKKLTSCLIDKVGGADSSELKKTYMV